MQAADPAAYVDVDVGGPRDVVVPSVISGTDAVAVPL